MRGNKYIARRLVNIYRKLYAYFGPQHWWPADNAFEVIIGAILTQNTAWTNVEKAIFALKKKRLLSPKKLYNCKPQLIAQLIRPCGYYNIKTSRIKSFLTTLFTEYKGRLATLLSLDCKHLREKLLGIKGIGPETADSIVLYAAGKPVFVVDAYTKRLLLRHKLIGQKDSYTQIQGLFEANLPRRASLFNEYHALIVSLGKQFCRHQPRCQSCPLRENRKKLKEEQGWF